MADFLLLMHDDAPKARVGKWGPYLAGLRAAGVFQGGSAIGAGSLERKVGPAAALLSPVTGFIRVTADDLAQARRLLAGNPVFEAGGTVEIHELPRDG
jgi:hypothetical protein